MQLLRIQPTAAFGVDWTAKMIFIVVIGGLGRIEGPIVGTIVFFLLQETLADYGSLYLIILGARRHRHRRSLAPRGLWGALSGASRRSRCSASQRRLVLTDPGRPGRIAHREAAE